MLNRTSSILIVDDDEHVRLLFSDFLRDKAFEVRDAATGLQALELVGKQPPAVELLDVRLPDMNGVEVCRELKNDPKSTDVFVALCSGEATDSGAKIGGLEVGADEYLVKPFGIDE